MDGWEDLTSVTEILLSQFLKQLVRKMIRLEDFDLPEEAGQIIKEIRDDAAEMYEATLGITSVAPAF